MKFKKLRVMMSLVESLYMITNVYPVQSACVWRDHLNYLKLPLNYLTTFCWVNL